MRYLEPLLRQDLEKKMVFLTGPRQSGKTTLAKTLLKSSPSGRYLNWDDPDHRKEILKRSWSDHEETLVLDEIHKLRNWKNWLKGTYDTQRDVHKFLITGSARLDVYRKGGDSLMGRYHLWHLHPFTLSELPARITPSEGLKRLLNVGGFPEPFLDGDDRAARRWRLERVDKVIKEDVRELEEIKNIQGMQLLVGLLRERVGSPIVISNLAEDLQVSPITVKKWIEVLEAMYVLFQVRPYTVKIPRALQKPPKIYFYDNADVEGDEGARFENLVATHLLKALQFAQDYSGHVYGLHYLRDKEKREVDFLITKNRRPIQLIEAKWADTAVSPSLAYYAEKIDIPEAIQIVGTKDARFVRGRLRVSDAFSELSDLNRYV